MDRYGIPSHQRRRQGMQCSHLHSFLDAFQDNPLLTQRCHQVPLREEELVPCIMCAEYMIETGTGPLDLLPRTCDGPQAGGTGLTENTCPNEPSPMSLSICTQTDRFEGSADEAMCQVTGKWRVAVDGSQSGEVVRSRTRRRLSGSQTWHDV